MSVHEKINEVTPKVLILLAAYNGEETIEKQIRCILEQIGVEVYVVVNVDRSEDSTVERLQSMRHTYFPKLEVRNTGERYGSAGANFYSVIEAVDIDDFSYIGFSDQDDFWYSNKLQRAIGCIQQYQCDGYSSAVKPTWTDGKSNVFKQSSRDSALDYLFEGAGQGCTYVFKSLAFVRIQKYLRDNLEGPRLFHHDWLCYLILRRTGHRWYFDDRPSMEYLQNEMNETGARNSYRGILHRINLVRSDWYKEQIQLAIRISQEIGDSCDQLDYAERVAISPKSISRNIQLSLICLRFGRRKLIDRAATAIFAALGWI